MRYHQQRTGSFSPSRSLFTQTHLRPRAILYLTSIFAFASKRRRHSCLERTSRYTPAGPICAQAALTSTSSKDPSGVLVFLVELSTRNPCLEPSILEQTIACPPLHYARFAVASFTLLTKVKFPNSSWGLRLSASFCFVDQRNQKSRMFAHRFPRMTE